MIDPADHELGNRLRVGRVLIDDDRADKARSFIVLEQYHASLKSWHCLVVDPGGSGHQELSVQYLHNVARRKANCRLVWCITANYSGDWEVECCYATATDARADLKVYRAEVPGYCYALVKCVTAYEHKFAEVTYMGTVSYRLYPAPVEP